MEWKFVKDLRKFEQPEFRWSRTAPKNNEISIQAGFKIQEFPAVENLQSALKSLKRRLQAAGLPKSGKVPLIFKFRTFKTQEEFLIQISREKIQIEAGDSEGFRRAVYRFIDLLQSSDGPFLTIGKIHEKPWLKSRISRCYFGPVNRPPFYRDELTDEIAYYPEAYLEKLAHEGINGLWLTVVWQDFLKPDAGKRLDKLRQTAPAYPVYGSVSRALGDHDLEHLYDAWPERPDNQKSALRLELRYFRPDYTGKIIQKDSVKSNMKE